jgi:hypothetical protein
MTLQLTRPRPGGGSPASGFAAAPLAVIRREWAAAILAACALFASGVAVLSANPPQRLWGTFAVGAYGAAAVAAGTSSYLERRLGWRHGMRLALLISLVGALIAPLTWMAATGLGQPEITVIIRAAALLLHHGAPYPGAAAIAAAHGPYAYSPYTPALLAFGMPHALFGGGLLTDPRLWFAAVFVIAFGRALSVAGVARPWLWTALVSASPVIAFPLSTSGDDLPVLALMCLGLALLGSRPRLVGAGLVLGLAAAMKATAWPALAVALVLVAVRDGRRGTAWFTASALAVAGVADGPVLLRQPGAMMANTVAFPLGLTKIKSPAASLLPGHLIAQAWAGGGHWVAIALVAVSGLAVAWSLMAWPPRDPQAAGWRLVAGLTLMFTFAPATRFGYFVYPLGLSAWLLLTTHAGRRPGPRHETVTYANRRVPVGLQRPRPLQPPERAIAAGCRRWLRVGVDEQHLRS